MNEPENPGATDEPAQNAQESRPLLRPVALDLNWSNQAWQSMSYEECAEIEQIRASAPSFGKRHSPARITLRRRPVTPPESA